jgi:hypothetical protein
MEYKGIKIWEEPRRGSVKRVQNLKNQWYLRNMPLEKLNQNVTFSEACNECIKKDPVLLSKFMEFQQEVEEISLVMLVTTLTHDEVKAIEDQLSVKEFDELIVTSRNALGGGVEDFFAGSISDMSLRTSNQPKSQDSTSSSDQPGGSSAGSTEPSMESPTNSLS